MAQQPRIYYPPTNHSARPNYKLSNVNFKPEVLPSKFRQPYLAQEPSSSISKWTVAERRESLQEVRLMISQFQYNVFHQKCVADRNLLHSRKDLNVMVVHDFWNDCCNGVIHVAVTFARFLHLEEFMTNGRDGMRLPYGVDLPTVGSVLQQLEALITKYYDNRRKSLKMQANNGSGDHGFRPKRDPEPYGRKVLSTSLPQNLLSSRLGCGAAETVPGGFWPPSFGTTIKGLMNNLENIISLLARDENSFPRTGDPTPTHESPRQTKYVSFEMDSPIETKPTSYYSSNERRDKGKKHSVIPMRTITSDLLSAAEVDSDYITVTTATEMSSTSATSVGNGQVAKTGTLKRASPKIIPKTKPGRNAGYGVSVSPSQSKPIPIRSSQRNFHGA